MHCESQLIYRFKPTHTITAFELAQIIERLGLTMTVDEGKKMPLELLRYFVFETA